MIVLCGIPPILSISSGGEFFMFKAWSSKSITVVSMFWGATVFAQSQPAIELPESPAKEHRVESQYGPNVSILNPLFPRDNKISIGLGGTYQSLSSLHNSFGGTVSAAYHLNLRHTIEPIYFNYQKASMSDFVTAQVRDESTSTENSTVSVSLPKYIYAATYYYTPYYSKMHIGYSTVAHFDFFFGGGLAYIAQEETFLNGTKKGDTSSFGANLSTGMRFLFRPRFGLRFELKDFIYKSQDFGKKEWVNNLQLALSFDVFFGSFPKRD